MNFSIISRSFLVAFLLFSSFACSFSRKTAETEPQASAVEQDTSALEEELPPGVKDVQVARVQQALNKGGAALDVDGEMGKRTRAAIKKFQKSNGLKVSGRIDEETMLKLGVVAAN